MQQAVETAKAAETSQAAGTPAAAIAAPKEHSVARAVVRSAGMIAFLTLLSRVLGLVRDMGGAGVFGAGAMMDAFVFAWMMPNLFRELFGEGALNAAFVPVFSDYLVNKSKEEAVRLFNTVSSALFLILSGIAIVALLGSLPIQWLLPLQISGRDMGLQFALIRILFPYILLICFVALAMGLLNSLRHFTMPAFAPVVLNIFWIAGIFWLAPAFASTPKGQIVTLAWIVLFSGVAQILIQIPPILKSGVRIKPNRNFREPGFRRIVKLLVPRMIGLAPVKINVVMDQVIAMTLAPVGANSVLYFGSRMMQFPLAIIGTAMATAIFPILARHGAKNEMAEMKKATAQTLRLTLMVAIPASLGLIFLANPIIRLFFQMGRFDAAAATRTAWVLGFFGAGVWIFCCLQIIARVFYAIGDTKTPTKVAVITVVLNLILNLCLVRFMDAAGLALSTTICATVNMCVLVYALNTRGIKVWGENVGRFALKLAIASAVMTLAGIAAVKAASAFSPAWAAHLGASLHLHEKYIRKLDQLLVMSIPLVLSAAVFLAAAWALKIQELRTILNSLLRRKSTVKPQGV